MITELLPLDAVRPSSYNPRTADAERLDLIALSLRKLGFLLPIYADADGEILSGHQRHLVAERLGFDKVPVVKLKPMALADRQNINVVFNRATNDLAVTDTPQTLTRELRLAELHALADTLPDKSPGSAESFPCMNTTPLRVADLVRVNTGRWIEYATAISRTLHRKGVVMPLICTPDLHVVNGIGRLRMLAELKAECAEAVIVSEAEAAFSDAMLNYLSMDFDIHTRYADLLRHNSFRRAYGNRVRLGTGMLFAMMPRSASNLDFDIRRSDHRAQWVQFYGRTVLDFGAGRMDEVVLLREAGVDASAFEPYCLSEGNTIDPDKARAVGRVFLAEIAAGKQWRSVFFSAILNSVPFAADREHVVQVVAACCGANTTLYTYATRFTANSNRSARGGGTLTENGVRSIQFILDYEPNILLGEFGSRPKVQKFFTDAEYRALFVPHFGDVKIDHTDKMVRAVCRRPARINVAQLREAIAFEFDLPMPDGQRLGLVDEALSAFGQRLGVKL